ncbi:MAG: formyltransferase [Opitutus sp.]|nr:formyltransferase [Opitutus sp.]MCS6248592.1 formyltransferase [Opitutus sp.]MCS6274303.1 formyltransferase [Opitutus sp.]MCS6278612.1 formyltransferase [Opitutus sp.]MCS6298483.1 formyltransferase [Opitutus sp.]
MSLRVVFLGNHTVGVRTLTAIRQQALLVGVVAHPDDPEDGVRYESVHAEAVRLGVPAIRSTGKAPALKEFIRACAPDLLWIADFRYLLPPDVVALASLGAVNLHPSLLPAYRGRASINWAILRGEARLGLTAHIVEAGMDTGDIVGQSSYELRADQDVGDALNLLYPIYGHLTAEVLSAYIAGRVTRRPQNQSEASEFPRRTPADGAVDWTRSAREVRDLIRAVARPYPGAFAPTLGGCVRLWRAGEILRFSGTSHPAPGEILEAAHDGHLRVACKDASLLIIESAWEGVVHARPSVGVILGDGSPQNSLRGK